jgi:hypothetical protein
LIPKKSKLLTQFYILRDLFALKFHLINLLVGLGQWRNRLNIPQLMSDRLSWPRPRLLLLRLLLLYTLTTLVDAGTNCSAADATRNCVDGLVVPLWRPFLDLSVGDRVLRGGIYFLAIAYMFLGVSIVADRFMSGIEVITR